MGIWHLQPWTLTDKASSKEPRRRDAVDEVTASPVPHGLLGVPACGGFQREQG